MGGCTVERCGVGGGEPRCGCVLRCLTCCACRSVTNQRMAHSLCQGNAAWITLCKPRSIPHASSSPREALGMNAPGQVYIARHTNAECLGLFHYGNAQRQELHSAKMYSTRQQQPAAYRK